jgi:hypothetical protein
VVIAHVGSNPARGMDACVSELFFHVQVEAFATGHSSPTKRLNKITKPPV